MFEYRCRTTPEPVNGTDGIWTWEILPDHFKLCGIDADNCPENSWCGAPYLHEHMKY
jgi:hypothetical protein